MAIAKQHFVFHDIGAAQGAMDAWNALQRAQNLDVSLFHMSYDGVHADVSLTNISLSVQDAFAAFLAQHYAGKHTVHDAPQVQSLYKHLFDD